MALADTVGLRALGLGAGVVDILHRQVELVFVPLMIAAVFGAAVGEHAAEPNVMLVEERQHAVVQQVSTR